MTENTTAETTGAIETPVEIEGEKSYTVEETLQLALKLGEAASNAVVAEKLASNPDGGPEVELAKVVVKLYDIAGQQLGQEFRRACESIGADVDKVFED